MPRTTHHVPERPQQPEPAGDLPPAGSNVIALPLHGGRDRPAGAAEAVADLLVTIPDLFGEPFRDPIGAALTAADQRWFATLTTRWVHQGFPADLRVSFSLSDALEILGSTGSEDPALSVVRASLLRLRAATGQSTRDSTIWGLVERASIRQTLGGPAGGWVELSRNVTELLQDGSVAYLHAPTWDRMREQDEVASRLWVFLETQEMPTLGRRYDMFSGPADRVPRRRALPAATELAGGGVERIRLAIRALAEVDPRYVAQIVKSGRPGNWRLEVRRRRLLDRPRGDG